MHMRLKQIAAIPVGVAVALLLWWFTGFVVPPDHTAIRVLILALLATIVGIVGGVNSYTQSSTQLANKKPGGRAIKWLGKLMVVCISVLILVIVTLIVRSLGDAIPEWMGGPLVVFSAIVLLLLNIYIRRRWL